MPSAAVAASENDQAAMQTQELFHVPIFAIYTNRDVIGVELGGALKNVIAIAAGVLDGLGFGDNSKAALVTRAIAEIRRVGVACGAKAETFSGLSGLGDLTVTCFSRQSRNRALGERIGKRRKDCGYPAHPIECCGRLSNRAFRRTTCRTTWSRGANYSRSARNALRRKSATGRFAGSRHARFKIRRLASVSVCVSLV